MSRVFLPVVFLVFLPALLPAQTASELLQEAFYLEVGRCDPEAAIACYRRILALKSRSPEAAAKAHLRIGVCFETLGDREQAREQYGIVLKSYATVEEASRLARRHLGNLGEDPARFMPPKVLFYVELVKPGLHVVNVADIVRGTPFQNPIDTPARTEKTPTGDGRVDLGPVELAKAFLNRFYLRELTKIGGLAVGIPQGGDPRNDFLGVFFPGTSDVLPGLVSSFLTVFPRVGTVGGLQLIRLSRDEVDPAEERKTIYLAFGDDMLLWGRPREAIESAVRRFYGDAPSLATHPEFLKAQERRSGTLLFSYVGPAWVDLLRSGVKEEARPAFDSFREILGLDRLRPISVTVSKSPRADTLSARLEAGLRGATPRPFWEVLVTPEVDGRLLQGLSDECLGFLALRFGGTAKRWASLQQALSELARRVGPAQDVGIRQLQSRLDTQPARELLSEVDGIVLTAHPTHPFAWFRSLMVVVSFRDADKGEALLKDTVARALKREIRKIEIQIDGKNHVVDAFETWPGFGVYLLRRDDRMLLALSRDALAAGLRGMTTRNDLVRWVPAGASKVLYLRPASILDALDGRERDPPDGDLQPFLRHFKHTVVYSRESTDGVSIELQVPEITPTLRAVLNTLATRIAAESEQ